MAARTFETHRALFLLVATLAGTVSAYADAPAIRLTTSQDSDGVFHTRGEVSLPYSTAVVDRAMQALDDYNVWAPRGQDGKDPASAQEIVQLTGVDSRMPLTVLVYRIHLVWPFGSEDNRLALTTRFPTPADGVVRRIVFQQQAPSIAVDRLEGDFFLFPEGQGSLVRLDCQVRLSWFLRSFFPLSFYRQYVVNRLQTMLASFAQYVQDEAAQ